MCQLPKSACVIFFFSLFKSYENSLYMGSKKKTQLWILSFYFMLIGNGKVLGLYLDTHAALPPLAWAVNSHFPVSVLINSQFPVFLHSERRKTGNCRNTADAYGGNPAKRFFRLFVLLLLVVGSRVWA